MSMHQASCIALILSALSTFAVPSIVVADEPELLIADFEGDNYGAWKVEGTAFGTRPAAGTLPNQMHVEGFLGKGLVNSYLGGDEATGRLTSPEFPIQRKFISFLIGGGAHHQKTCVNLVVDGQVVRSSTGSNSQAGGSERLEWDDWDVAQFQGKRGRIEIVDDFTGGWGHINVDHILQGDRRRGSVTTQREIEVTAPYLQFGVRTGAPLRRVNFHNGGQLVYEADMELVDADPEFAVYADVRAYRGQRLTLEAKLPAETARAFERVQPVESIPASNESRRPLVHFTSRRGWLNDPNGMVFLAGEWHLFYQHNPFGWNWGNMHWGHAVTRDLLHWEELPTALFAKPRQDMAFSGSAVVDRENTSGFKQGDNDVLVAAYTSTGRGECIAYSTDRGRTWQEYAGNPVVKHQGRDPRLLWHAASKQWSMAVYDEHPEVPQGIAFYTSPNLKDWTFRSRIRDYFECPDLFELPVDKGPATKWVLSAADGKYVLGQFDGGTFTPDPAFVASGKQQLWFGNFYAAQSFSDAPDGRRIQIGWGQGIEFRGQPFNQQMTLPVELSLRTTPAGVRMTATPVREWDRVARRSLLDTNGPAELVVKSNDPLLGPPQPRTSPVELSGTVEPGNSTKVVFQIRGTDVIYDVRQQQLTCRHVTAPIPLRAGKLPLRVIGDRGSLEIFAHDGEFALSVADSPQHDSVLVRVTAEGGDARLRNVRLEEVQFNR